MDRAWEQSPPKKKKILIVDDEPDIAVSTKKGLDARGFEANAYIDPQTALSDFAPGKYDLAILDLKMPGMNGFELCRRIRAQDEKIKIFFLSAIDIHSEEFRLVFPKLDVSSIVKKPASIDNLVLHINAQF